MRWLLAAALASPGCCSIPATVREVDATIYLSPTSCTLVVEGDGRRILRVNAKTCAQLQSTGAP